MSERIKGIICIQLEHPGCMWVLVDNNFKIFLNYKNIFTNILNDVDLFSLLGNEYTLSE